MNEEKTFKSGFITLIGRPNVGKSTLLNELMNQKIAITSDKAQTTRNRISGIMTEEDYQMVFIDTPGIHKPKHQLGSYMVSTAFSTLNEVDVVMFMVNATEKRGPGDTYIMDRLQHVEVPIFLIVNKIDQVHPNDLPDIVAQYTDDIDFAEIFPISAQEGTNVEHLKKTAATYLKEGPQYFPSDQVTDHPERFLMREIIREKVLQLTQEEVPHSVATTIDSVHRNEDDKLEVAATIIVERSSQKGILIGKNGKMIKEIGIRARKDMEKLLGDKIYLDLWVRVQKDWRNREQELYKFGYDEEEY